MQTALVVSIESEDNIDPAQLAEDMLSDLEELGWPVVSVNPWSSPGAAAQPTTLDDIARAMSAQQLPPPVG